MRVLVLLVLSACGYELKSATVIGESQTDGGREGFRSLEYFERCTHVITYDNVPIACYAMQACTRKIAQDPAQCAAIGGVQ